MSAQINFHDGLKLRAYSHRVSGSLSIEIDSDDRACPDNVTIFTQDQTLTDRLVEVINATIEARREEIAAAARTLEDAA
jgi:hypothetical protein